MRPIHLFVLLKQIFLYICYHHFGMMYMTIRNFRLIGNMSLKNMECGNGMEWNVEFISSVRSTSLLIKKLVS